MNISESEQQTADALYELVKDMGLTLVLNGLARIVAASDTRPNSNSGPYWRVFQTMEDLAGSLPDAQEVTG